MAKKHLNKSRLFLALALIVGTIVGADSIRRDYFVQNDNLITVKGSFKNPDSPVSDNSSTVLSNTSQPASQTQTEFSYPGYSELTLPAAQLSSGLLTIINQNNSALISQPENLKALADVKNEYYSLRSDELMLSSEAADALNIMMTGYANATGLSDFIIYSTTQAYTEDSICPAAFDESVTGNTVDLAVQGSSRILPYDGKDEEAWIIENCADYGFIVRYPQGKEAASEQNSCVWHLRYVGKLHSSIMKQNNLCLEEYIEWIKSYTFSAPYIFQCNGINYQIYYAASMGDITSVKVPDSGNYSISGNNTDGYIIASVK